jgi:hypothetical protein
MTENTVNKLMDILPEDPVDWTNEHIEQVIAWQKKMFFNREENFGKKKSDPVEQSFLFEKVMKEIAQEQPKQTKMNFKRRI